MIKKQESSESGHLSQVRFQFMNIFVKIELFDCLNYGLGILSCWKIAVLLIFQHELCESACTDVLFA